jgi:uroporphyrinogen decarboxylase
MNTFEPDYRNLQKAAYNQTPQRLPLYEHIIAEEVMEDVLGKEFRQLYNGDSRDIQEFMENYCNFYLQMGYDTVSFECVITKILPYGGLLGGQGESVIKNYQDFENYPWEEITDIYFSTYDAYFEALQKAMPAGMKAVGGVGNGVFECVQDITGFLHLADLCYEEPELYAALFKKTGEVLHKIWARFIDKYGDAFCVLRFGDDLGFKTNTLLSTDDIREFIIPEYRKIIDLAHNAGKPFLLHSCGRIFNVMPDLIETAKINAKHSNEDQIAAFPVWVEKYGEKIALFGGIDTDALCRLSMSEIKEYVTDTLNRCNKSNGIAFGSGNSIANYVPIENYLEMVKTVKEYRSGATYRF